MYYWYRCSYCSKLFYTFSNPRQKKYAAERLYYGIKKHLIDYREDHKEFEFDDPAYIEVRDMYNDMTEQEDRPSGGYPV